MHSRTAAGVIGGRYRINGLLGEGGMARVFDAFDERLDRLVAVKVLRPETEGLPGMRQRFQQEARIAARLVHPNIVAVLDFGEHDACSYLVMERLPGATLRDEITCGPLSHARLAQVTSEVLAALAAAHRCGVLHRDIKPSNILLQEDGRATLSDFGIAKSFDLGVAPGGPPDDLTLTGVVLGTPGYLAPERRAGCPATVQSDLYGVGAVMVEAATGCRVEPGNTPMPDGCAALRGPFSEVARRALAGDPTVRFSSAEAMQRALRETPAPSQPLAPSPRTQPTAIAGAAPRTAVLPRPPAGPPLDHPARSAAGPPPVPPVGRRRRTGGRAILLTAVTLVASLGALFLALSQGTQPTGPASRPAHQVASASVQRQTTTTTTQDTEVLAMDALARSLESEDGTGGALLGAALETTAAQPAGPARQDAAQQTLVLARVLLASGGITHSQYVEVVTTLAPTGATPTTAPTTPTGGPGDLGQPGGPLGGHGRGPGPGSDDQG